MTIKKIPLTKEKFDLLKTTEGWNIDEVPKEYWKNIPGIQRLQDTIGIMASGSSSDPRIMHGINAIAGIDVLTFESKPNYDKGEKEGNAYHYVFQLTGDSNYPYTMYGPYTHGMNISHWYDVNDLETYWKIDED